MTFGHYNQGYNLVSNLSMLLRKSSVLVTIFPTRKGHQLDKQREISGEISQRLNDKKRKRLVKKKNAIEFCRETLRRCSLCVVTIKLVSSFPLGMEGNLDRKCLSSNGGLNAFPTKRSPAVLCTCCSLHTATRRRT